MAKRISIFLLIIITIYTSFCVYLYFTQEAQIFPSYLVPKDDLKKIKKKYPEIKEINLRTKDNIKLHGWFINNSKLKKSPLIIYF